MTTFLTTSSSKMDVSAATMSELVAFYNALSGKPPIKKFETRAKGVERCTRLLLPSANPGPIGGTEEVSNTGVELTTAPSPVIHKLARATPKHIKISRRPSVTVITTAAGATVLKTSAMAAIAKVVTKKPAAKKPAAKKPAAKSVNGTKATDRRDGKFKVVDGDSVKRGAYRQIVDAALSIGRTFTLPELEKKSVKIALSEGQLINTFNFATRKGVFVKVSA